MGIKCALLKLAGSLILSTIVVYVVLAIAKTFRQGESYGMSSGESFIIWILMAILISSCWRCCGCKKK
tara:strand:+ start:100 stop:303 length:204 start_codon:yes stop_codon:yes gene_type:complete